MNPSSGSVQWRRRFPSSVYGAATVSNDVVFTSTLNGKVYALSTRDGSTLWSAQAPVGRERIRSDRRRQPARRRGGAWVAREAPDQRADRVFDRLAKKSAPGRIAHRAPRCRRNLREDSFAWKIRLSSGVLFVLGKQPISPD